MIIFGSCYILILLGPYGLIELLPILFTTEGNTAPQWPITHFLIDQLTLRQTIATSIIGSAVEQQHFV